MLSYDPPKPATQGQKDARPTKMQTNSTNLPNSASTQPDTGNNHHIWLVTGPAGCGKSTVAEHLAQNLDMPYIEGDSFHTPANVEKMRTGTPLTDADRWDWLTALREESTKKISAGAPGVVLTCSALKRKYRDVIRVAAYFHHDICIHFLFLDAPEELLLNRVMQRKGHYMGANMVHSQFDILERPSEDERDVITIDVSRTIDDVKADALDRVFTVVDKVHEDN